MCAPRNGPDEIVQTLLDSGTLTDHQNNKRETGLSYAAILIDLRSFGRYSELVLIPISNQCGFNSVVSCLSVGVQQDCVATQTGYCCHVWMSCLWRIYCATLFTFNSSTRFVRAGEALNRKV
jgi:hypothetical protein